jgi:hypothetical protein
MRATTITALIIIICALCGVLYNLSPPAPASQQAAVSPTEPPATESPTPPPTATESDPPTATPPPTATLTPQPTPTPIDGPLVYISRLDAEAELVELRNLGNQPQPLDGWTLISIKGEQACPLAGAIAPGETLIVYALAEDAGQNGFNCGFSSNIWNNDDTDPAALVNPAGAEVSRCTYEHSCSP